MTVTKIVGFWIGMACLLAGAAVPAFAQQPAPRPPAGAPAAAPQTALPAPGTPTVVADVILVLQEAAAAQSIRTQLEKRRTTYQGEVQKEENDLRNAEQELARQRTILSPEAFAQKRREFEKRVADAQQNAQNRRRILDQAFGDAMQNVQQAMFDVIGDILLEQKYQVVLPKAQVVVMQTSLDITPEVLRRLNKKMPTVTVTFPPK